ncbi:MAG: DNRLRE domain-containing protein, partial [Saprospiraceae bacterium]|nr:DNRLRE domain-containing protein [Saprospiraceae bacterium]
MKYRTFLLSVCLVMGLTPNDLRAAIVDVYVYNTEFSINPPGNPVEPAIITQGDTIRWIWVQGGHTTTAVAGSAEQWNEPVDSENPLFTRVFNTTGVFWYYCIPHGSDNGDGTASGMASTITVLAAGSGACCLPDGTCTTSDESNCLTQGGVFHGVGSSCDTTACPVSVDLTAARDNILYEDPAGALSNALGNYLYVGKANAGIRRSVLAFDLSMIPVQAEIQSAQLQLYCNSSSGSAFPLTLQRLLQDWGEGSSEANGNESSGAASTPGDATWLHPFYDTSFWSIPGGDFSETISASTIVGAQNSAYV